MARKTERWQIQSRSLLILMVLLQVVVTFLVRASNAQAVEPTTIRVLMTSLGGSPPPVHSVSFSTDYLHRVLVSELGGPCVWDCQNDWPGQAVGAMAVAARSLGWYYIKYPLNDSYDVTDFNPQRYREDLDYLIRDLIETRVSNTQNYFAAFDNRDSPPVAEPIWAGHYTQTGDPTLDASQTGPDWPCGGNYPGGDRRGYPFNEYLRSVSNPVDDPASCAENRRYVGLSQLGSGHWAEDYGDYWPQIINQAFSSIFIQKAVPFTADYYTLDWHHLGTRTDDILNFDWGTASPWPGRVPADEFSVRWTGTIDIPWSAWWTFYVEGDDGIYLVVNDRVIINEWYDQARTFYSGSIYLNAGTANVKMYYYERYGEAVAKLSWLPTPGLVGEYHSGTDPNTGTILMRRPDPALWYHWWTGQPEARVPRDYFSTRWKGRMYVTTSGNHTFEVTADDGVKLWVDGELLIDEWHIQGPTTYTATKFLGEGVHHVQMDYFENNGWAVARLNWWRQ